MVDLSHSPHKVKEQERRIAYNPFWMDLTAEGAGFKLNPNWDREGVTLLWLLKEGISEGLHGSRRLVLGVEAANVPAMRRFLDLNCPEASKKFSDEEIEGMLDMGHPTLACEIKTMATIQTTISGVQKLFTAGYIFTPEQVGEVFKDQNYKGILGGEIHFEGGKWMVNFHSGRFGFARASSGLAKEETMRNVKLMFKRHTDADVELVIDHKVPV